MSLDCFAAVADGHHLIQVLISLSWIPIVDDSLKMSSITWL